MSRHGTQLAPDGSVPASHELARCAVCQSILYDVPVLLDGCPIGKVAFRCPHCDDRRPLERSVALRHARPAEPLTPAEIAAQQAYQRRAALGAERKRITDDEHRAQIIAAIHRFVARRGRPPTQAEMGHSGPVRVPGLASRSLVARLFGAPRHALAAAGHPVPERKARGMARTVAA